MSLIGMVGLLLIVLAVAWFAYWVIGTFCPPPAQKFAWAIFGLVALIFFIWLVSSLTGASLPTVHTGR